MTENSELRNWKLILWITIGWAEFKLSFNKTQNNISDLILTFQNDGTSSKVSNKAYTIKLFAVLIYTTVQ